MTKKEISDKVEDYYQELCDFADKLPDTDAARQLLAIVKRQRLILHLYLADETIE